jgi:hypothetical protein
MQGDGVQDVTVGKAAFSAAPTKTTYGRSYASRPPSISATTTAPRRPAVGKALRKTDAKPKADLRRNASPGSSLNQVPSPLRADSKMAMMMTTSSESTSENSQPSWMSKLTSVSSSWEKRFIGDAENARDAEEEALMVEKERKKFKQTVAKAAQRISKGNKAHDVRPIGVMRTDTGRGHRFTHLTAECSALNGEDSEFDQDDTDMMNIEDWKSASVGRGGEWLLRAAFYQHYIGGNATIADALYQEAAEKLVGEQATRSAALFWHAQLLADAGARGGAAAAKNTAFAIDLLKRLVEYHPKHARARVLLGLLLARTFPANLEEPTKLIEDALRIEPLCPHALIASVRLKALRAARDRDTPGGGSKLSAVAMVRTESI